MDCDTDIDQLLELMRNQWGMELPKLLISVTGGAADGPLDESLRERFSHGLVKAAESTGTSFHLYK